MEIKKVSISQVQLWDKNPRNIKTKDFERLKKQIEELGVYKPLIAFKENGKYTVLGGNMRLRALQEMGIPEIDISIVKADSEAKKIKYALSDNDRAGEYDEQQLAELVYPHIEEIDLTEYKVDLAEPVDLKKVIEQFGPNVDGSEDELPEIDESPAVTKLGDLFTLGKHRLLCGDCGDEEQVMRLINSVTPDIILTDPPYGMRLDTDFSDMEGIGRGKKYKAVEGDDIDYDPAHIFKHFPKAKEVFLWGADYYAERIPDRNNGSWLVWDKMGKGGVNDDYEKMFGSNFELCWSRIRHKRALVRVLWKGIFGLSREDTKSRIHPTQKPTELFRWLIERFSKVNENVIDPFLGSGTTLIACEKLNRTCYGMEIEPKYCDVIIKRYCNYTENSEEDIRATVERNAK